MSIVVYKITSEELRSHERANHIIKVTPVEGNNLSASVYFQHAAHYYSKYQVLLTPPEVGCSLSHIKILKHFLSETSCSGAVILESDISFTAKQLSIALDICSRESFPFVHLGWHPNISKRIYFRGKHISSCTTPPIYEVDPRSNFHGTYSYYLNRATAAELLKFHQHMIHKADDWCLFFNGSITPYFCGIFHHPKVRVGTLSSSRLAIKHPSLVSLFQRKLTSLIKICTHLVWSRIRGYSPILPPKN